MGSELWPSLLQFFKSYVLPSGILVSVFGYLFHRKERKFQAKLNKDLEQLKNELRKDTEAQLEGFKSQLRQNENVHAVLIEGRNEVAAGLQSRLPKLKDTLRQWVFNPDCPSSQKACEDAWKDLKTFHRSNKLFLPPEFNCLLKKLWKETRSKPMSDLHGRQQDSEGADRLLKNAENHILENSCLSQLYKQVEEEIRKLIGS